MSLEIVYENPGGVGYHPVLHMVRLAAELLGARLIELPAEPTKRRHKLEAILPSRRGEGAGLLICVSPVALLSLLRLEGWRRRYGRVAAWVFDSFWVDRIPRVFQKRRHFDLLFVTELEDRDEWERRMRVPVEWLPWGSDVLRLGSDAPERTIDVCRVGRQPPPWEDDAASAEACRVAGLRFHGRPASHDDATENQRGLMAAFAASKFTLSFSNSVDPQRYTHPTRRYITGRWTDALAAGATVAGIPPESVPALQLLWPEALLDLRTIERDQGLAVLRAAAAAWTPERARINYRHALERLDWRRRFERIASALDVDAPLLRRELQDLDRRSRVRRVPAPAAGA